MDKKFNLLLLGAGIVWVVIMVILFMTVGA